MLKENCIYRDEDNYLYLVLGYKETAFFKQKTLDGIFNDCCRVMKYTPVQTVDQLRKEVILEDMTDVVVIRLGKEDNVQKLLQNPIPFSGYNFNYVFCESNFKKVDIDEEIVKQWIVKTQLVNEDFRYFYNKRNIKGVKETYKTALNLYKERFKDLFSFTMRYKTKNFQNKPVKVENVKPYHLYSCVLNAYQYYVISITKDTFLDLGCLITMNSSLFKSSVIKLQDETLFDTGVTCEFIKILERV